MLVVDVTDDLVAGRHLNLRKHAARLVQLLSIGITAYRHHADIVIRDVTRLIFGLQGLSPEAYLLPFLLPFLPLLLLPSLSFSFSFRLLPFSSRILFPGVPSSYPKSGYVWERCGIAFRTF